MNLTRNLSLRSKLILLAFVPMLTLLIYCGKAIVEDVTSRRNAQALIENVNQIEKMSFLVHCLQLERYLNITYRYLKTIESKEALVEQRLKTDAAIADLENSFGYSGQRNSSRWVIDSLPKIRERSDRAIFSDAYNERFIEGKSALLFEIGKILQVAVTPGLKNNIENHIRLVYFKDFLSLIRGYIATGIVNEKFDDAVFGIFYDIQFYRAFVSTKANYDLTLGQFRQYADADQIHLFDQTYNGDNVRLVQNMIDTAYINPRFRQKNGISPKWVYGTVTTKITLDKLKEWYSWSTNSIGLLKKVEDISLNEIKTRSEANLKAATSAVATSLILAAVLLAVVSFIVYQIVRDLTGSILGLKVAARRMAAGDVSDLAIDIRSKDEIGDLAVTFSQMIEGIREYSSAASLIGVGNYDITVPVRSQKDVLGNALVTMKDNLSKFSQEGIARNWLLSANAELNDKMRGDRKTAVLAQDVIAKVVTSLHAQVGTVYLRENEELSLVASYAFHQRKGNQNRIQMGQGLVGQAALEKKYIVFSDIPDDYVRIGSSIGHTAVKNLLIYPLIYENDVKGVLEIGSRDEFSSLEMEFMSMAAGNIAIAINSAQASVRLKELLEETQQQGEEMQSQQEELRKTNEGLTEKTRLLETSETELKAQQEELQQSNEELEEKANMLEAQKKKIEITKLDLEKKANELEQVSKYKTEFLANMSHELRTPLNSILVLSQLLFEDKHKVMQQREIEFSKNINQSGKDLLNLINEILDLSKIEAGKLQLEIEEVSLKEIIQDAHTMFDEIANKKSVRFEARLHDDIPQRIETDKMRLIQIIRNLLSNAFKFTEKGGNITFDIRLSDTGAFHSGAAANVKSLLFSVTDDGIGIPKEKQKIVFEAFQQADGSTKRKYGGTGLGLSICRELANALGGEIQLESEAGRGTVFKLFLPLGFIDKAKNGGVEVRTRDNAFERSQPEEERLTEHAVEDDRASTNSGDRSIVIIEDDGPFSSVLLELVRQRHYKGIVAGSGEAGMKLIRRYQPVAILLDLNLPAMGGEKVLQELKSDATLRHIPVQVITGGDSNEEQIVRSGAAGYLRKPASTNDLLAAIDSIGIHHGLKNILVVEDNVVQSSAIGELLAADDVKCYPAYSGSEAFALMQTVHFDCVIVDLGLPDMSEFELLEKIKNDPKLAKIPVIVYTGKDLSPAEAKQLERIANTVVLKTVDSHDRLLDETRLFLHQVESLLPAENQHMTVPFLRTHESLHGKTALIVDDDMRNVYTLKNLLDDAEIKCVVAETGLEALQRLEEHQEIDIVLMDVMMPEMDGYEATRAIRKMKKFSNLPIIGLTAKAMKADRERCLEAGMSDYVSKPIDPAKLLTLMRIWIYK